MAVVFDAPDGRGRHRVATGSDAVQTFNSHMSRSGETADTLLYIVNYDDTQGFAVISAPQNVEPVIAVVEKGDFAEGILSDESAFSFFIDAAVDYIQSSSACNVSPQGNIVITPGSYDKYKLVYDKVEPKLIVEWGQNFPEGYYCPNKICGCVQTAVAQILSFYELPTTIELTYKDCDKSVQLLDWASIKKHVTSQRWDEIPNNAHLTECPASVESHYVLARLCRQLGELNIADYRFPTATGAFPEDAQLTLEELLPSKYVSKLTRYDKETMFAAVKDGIVYIGGEDVIANAGHAWVADGGLQSGRIRYTYATGEKDPITDEPLLFIKCI